MLKIINPKDERRQLKGITMRYNGGGILTLYASDWHRLMRKTFECVRFGNETITFDHILNYDTCKEIAKQKVKKGAWRIRIEPTRLSLQTCATIAMQFVDAKTIDFERLIPTECPKGFTVSKDALEVLASGCVGASRGVKARTSTIILDVSEDATLTVSATLHDTGLNCSGTMPTVKQSNAMRVGLNGSYLLDCLEAMPGKVTFSSDGVTGSPIRITNGDPSLTYVIMPMRV